MKKNCILLTLIIFSTVFNNLKAQVFKLHAEYTSDWYGQGFTMNEDISGYPSTTLRADSVADQFVIEADNGFNRWRKYGTTAYDTAFPTVWYTLIVTDNYFSVPTTLGYYYTTRLKNVNYSSTNFIVMQTEREPVNFAASNPVSQVPQAGSIADSQTVTVTINLDTIPCLQEKFFIRYSSDNFLTSSIAPVSFGIPNSTIGMASIPPQSAGTTINYYAFSSTVDATQATLANDYDLVTLRLSANQGSNYTYTVAPALAKVTFNVNMSNETVSTDGVFLVGSFNNFDTLETPMNAIGGNIYQVALFLDTTSIVQFKFLNGHSFSTEEQVPSICGVANGFGGYNRQLAVPQMDTELDTVCFSYCSNCTSAANVNIEFRVNMTQQTISADGVHLAGTFNGFDADSTLMINLGGGVFSATLSIAAGAIVEYKFINGNTFAAEESVPLSCGVSNGFGGFNRSLSVPQTNTTLNTVCFSSCVDCISPTFVNVIFRVNMSNEIVSANGVHLAGTFNGFDADSTLMNAIGAGVYEALVALDTTQTVSYKYINGNTFLGVENVPSACGVSDGFGGFNRTVVVPNISDTLEVVCFSSCSECNGVGINALQDTQIDFNLAPSVCSNGTTIHYTSAQENAAEITILTADGRIVNEYHLPMCKGLCSFYVSADELKAGIYFVQLNSNHKFSSKKFVVLK